MWLELGTAAAGLFGGLLNRKKTRSLNEQYGMNNIGSSYRDRIGDMYMREIQNRDARNRDAFDHMSRMATRSAPNMQQMLGQSSALGSSGALGALRHSANVMNAARGASQAYGNYMMGEQQRHNNLLRSFGGWDQGNRAMDMQQQRYNEDRRRYDQQMGFGSQLRNAALGTTGRFFSHYLTNRENDQTAVQREDIDFGDKWGPNAMAALISQIVGYNQLNPQGPTQSDVLDPMSINLRY